MNSFLKFLIFASLLVFLIPAHLYRVVYFNVIVEISVFIYLWLLVKNKIKPPKISLIGAAFFIFILVSALATIFSVEPAKSFWGAPVRSMAGGLFMYVHYFAFFTVLVSIFDNKEKYLQLLKWVVFIGFVAGLYGFYEKFISGISRTDSFFGNPIYFGMFSLFILFLGVYSFLAENRKIKYFYLLVAILSFFNIFTSLSRGPIVGLVGSLLIFVPLVFFLIIKQFKNNNKNILIVIVITTVFLAAGFQFLSNGNVLIKRFENLSSDTNVLNRLVSWKIALKAVKDRPILGWGQENFGLAFNKHFNPKFLSDISAELWFDRAHNNILDIATTTGILGTLSYLFIWVATFVALFYLFKNNNRKEAIIFSMLLIAYFIGNLTFFDSLIIFLLFMLVLGYIILLSAQPKTVDRETIWLKKDENRKIIFGAALILIIVGIFVNFQIAKASFYYYKMKFDKNKDFNELVYSYEKLSSIKPNIFESEANYSFSRIITKNKIDNSDLKKYIKKSSEKLDELKEKHPLDIKPYYYGAQVYLLDFNLNGDKTALLSAQKSLQKATEIAPNRQDIYMDLAQIEMSLENYDLAILNMEKARDLNPDYSRPHFYLAVLHIANDDNKNGEAEYEIANKLVIQYDKNDIPNLVFLADYFMAIDENKEALKILEKALSFDISNVIIRKKIAALYADIGNKDYAKAMALDILRDYPEKEIEVKEFINNLENYKK